MSVSRLFFRRWALAGIVALGLGGCVTHDDITGSIRATAALPAGTGGLQAGAGGLQAAADDWGRRYEADPSNRTVVLTYAATLRALDRNPQALAVLQTAAIKYPYDNSVLSAYGKTLADVGHLREAADVLSRAHTPDKPDWTVLSAQGSVADQLGDHAGAQGYYQAALKIAPDSATTLSNLGLSYALDKHLADAETVLRKAVALPGATVRVRQNLAFVLALEGKDQEAETLSRADLSPEDAAQSIAAVRAMVARTGDARPRKAARGSAPPAG